MAPAMQPPDSRQRWVSFDEARMILRMSEGTLRRAIRAGQVTAEQRRRNPDSPTDQRMVYEVLITEPPAPTTPTESPQAPPSANDPPASVTWYQGKLDERDETIAEKDARIMEAAERIADLSRELGEATTRGAMLQAERDALVKRLAEAEERLRRPWWRIW